MMVQKGLMQAKDTMETVLKGAIHVPTQNHIGSTSRVTPHMPQFLKGQKIGNWGQQGQGEDFTEVFERVSDSRGRFSRKPCLYSIFVLSTTGIGLDISTGEHRVGSFIGKWGSCPFLTLMALENPLLGHEYIIWILISNSTL
jgi:hypothetical protein